MTKHRFAYDHKAKKAICPACGHRRLRTYVDTKTGEPCDPKYGACDRNSTCGYHMAPSGVPTDYEPKKKMQPPPVRRTSWRCPTHYVSATQLHNRENILLKWLRSCVGVVADDVWTQYRIGTYPPGRRAHLMYATCFWQIGSDDMPRSAKIIPYGDNGKRVKEYGSTWMHSVITATPENPKGDSMETLGIGQCLFGEHLLRLRPDAVVAVVESEKSAVIGACFYPEVVWVATGGSNTFTVERCMALSGRKVVVFPDAGMYEDWLAHSIDISLMCESMVVSDILEAMGVPKGDDIADLLICEQDGQYIQAVDLTEILTSPAITPQPLQDTPQAAMQAAVEAAVEAVDPKRQQIDAWTNNVAQPWGNQQFMTTIAKSPMAEIFERPAIKELDAIFDLDKQSATLRPYDGTA